jgi:hypothetical protein
MNWIHPRAGVVALLALFAWALPGRAAPDRPLNEQLKTLGKLLRDSLKNDPKLKGKAVKIGLFSGPQLPSTNFGQRIRRQLMEELKGELKESADLTVTGRYDFVESDRDTAAGDDQFKLQVLRLTAAIEDRTARELVKVSVEVNNTDDIAQALGLTVAPPLHGSQKRRNQEAKQAQEKPAFKVLQRTRVAPTNFDNARPFSVEILVKQTPDGKAVSLVPEKLKGRPFVDIKENQFYEVRLHNDGKFEGAAEVLIDGLGALATFNKDKQKPTHYLIPAGGSTTIRGWLHTTKKGAKDSVLSFLVTEYGRGAATKFRSSGEVGVITVRFSAAWKEGDDPPAGERGARSTGRETTAGPGLPENLKVVKRHVGLIRSTVSIRYSPTGKKSD